MMCERCQIPATTIRDHIKEHTNEAVAHTEINRGFCFTCGSVFKPVNSNFLLTVHNAINPHGDGYTILEAGDTFSSLWVMLPIYRAIFETGPNKATLKILVRRTPPFEPLKEKTKFEVIYQEEVLPVIAFAE